MDRSDTPGSSTGASRPEGGGIAQEAGRAGGYGAQEPAAPDPAEQPLEVRRGSDADPQGARRSDGMTGSGPNTSNAFGTPEEDRATGTPATDRRD